VTQRNRFRRRVTFDTGRDTYVQQQFKEDADINNIIRRFGIGQLPVVHEGVYGDFTGITDYRSAVAAVARAEEGFMRLPAEARDRFGNDPGKFLEYAEQVSEAELIEVCGLQGRKEQPKVAPVVEAVVKPVEPPKAPVES